MSFIDESKKLYLKHRDEILSEFPSLESSIAFGAVGSGSEFYSFDDDISRDHDLEDGFIIFLSRDDYEKYGFMLNRLYRQLMPESVKNKSAMYKGKLGVIEIGEFYSSHIGMTEAPSSWQDWLYLPSYSLSEASNGEVFEDNLWEFSSIRNAILHGMPEDVRKKKISAACAMAAQSGQYNYSRCLKHGETGAAYIACSEFVKYVCQIVFLLNKAHAPYYKWELRAMRDLNLLSNLSSELEDLLTSSKDEKSEKIEKISYEIADELKRQNLSFSMSDYLEDHAISIKNTIDNREIRSLHIMEGI